MKLNFRFYPFQMDEPSHHSRTIADRLDADHSVSPLAGSKVVVSNLQESVTQEDIIELFGDIGKHC